MYMYVCMHRAIITHAPLKHWEAVVHPCIALLCMYSRICIILWSFHAVINSNTGIR